MSQQEIIQLLDRYLAGTATLPEQERVETWLNSNEDLNNDWEQMDEMQRTDFLASLYQRIKNSIGEEGRKEWSTGARGPLHETPGRHTKIKRMWKWTAAAAVLLLIAGSLWVVIDKHGIEEPPVALKKVNDIQAPSNTRAVITLADGSKVYLDSANNGMIAQENNVTVTKSKEGEIVYSPLTTTNSLIAYNTLFNPRGSKVISLTLSDGTKVWLNSESSLKYPAAFNSNTREVEITGEAYFEVKHNSKQPFKVHLPNGSVVEDIGTAFNINAYSDEASIKTTLIEGAVNVIASEAKQAPAAVRLSSPGKQAVITNPANPSILKILVSDNVDLEEVLAWKDGRFQFEGEGIESVMKQIARWYDVDIIYESKPKDHFRGGISRNVEASKVFKMLEEMGVVKFEIKGKQVIVKSP